LGKNEAIKKTKFFRNNHFQLHHHRDNHTSYRSKHPSTMSNLTFLDQKPNLRRRGFRKGIKTNNTVKLGPERQLFIQGSTSIIRHDNVPEGSRINAFVAEDSLHPNLEYSLNKKKRWEFIDDLKYLDNDSDSEDWSSDEDPEYKKKKTNAIVVKNSTNPAQRKPYREIVSAFNSPKDPETVEAVLVKGRKGTEIKAKRSKGKKGVKKHEPQPHTEVHHIYEVIETTRPADFFPVINNRDERKNFSQRRRNVLKKELNEL